MSYPTSCSPQAWAAASPLLLLRSILGFDPDVPRRRVRVRPALDRSSCRTLHSEGIPVADRRVTVSVAADGLPLPLMDWAISNGAEHCVWCAHPVGMRTPTGANGRLD